MEVREERVEEEMTIEGDADVRTCGKGQKGWGCEGWAEVSGLKSNEEKDGGREQNRSLHNLNPF